MGDEAAPGRKDWIENRLKELDKIFTVSVGGFRLMDGSSGRCLARMALYPLRNLFHSNELSPLQSLCRSLSRDSIISVYWSLGRLTLLGSNQTGHNRSDIAICSKESGKPTHRDSSWKSMLGPASIGCTDRLTFGGDLQRIKSMFKCVLIFQISSSTFQRKL
jgi:hypothetical protein